MVYETLSQLKEYGQIKHLTEELKNLYELRMKEYYHKINNLDILEKYMIKFKNGTLSIGETFPWDATLEGKDFWFNIAAGRYPKRKTLKLKLKLERIC